MALVVWLPDSPVHESPLVPVTVQDCALETFQSTVVFSPDWTMLGRIWSCPVRLPEELKMIDGARQLDEPDWQYWGETQLVVFVVEQSALVRTMVLPEQEYET